jgi:hypothetical protein
MASMSIYPADYPYYPDRLVPVQIGNAVVKVDKQLSMRVIGDYLLAWTRGLENTVQVLISDATPDVARFSIQSSIFKELLRKLDPVTVQYAWFAAYSGLIGRFAKLIVDNKDAKGYMEHRIGPIVLLRTMNKLPVEMNLDKVKTKIRENLRKMQDPVRGYISVYKTAVSFRLKDQNVMISNNGLSIDRIGQSEILDDEFAEKLYSIFDPLISDDVLEWWAELARASEEVILLYFAEER